MMKEPYRRDVDPVQHIRNLFDSTHDGRLAITYYPSDGEKPFERTYAMDWTAEDAEAIVNRYEALVPILERIGGMYGELLEADKRAALLTEEEQAVWNIYVRPFDAFEVSYAVINELYRRAEFDELTEEENDLLERCYAFEEAQCLERLPVNRCSPRNLIINGARYTAAVRWKAPAFIVHEEARTLAEEMVLYYGRMKEES